MIPFDIYIYIYIYFFFFFFFFFFPNMIRLNLITGDSHNGEEWLVSHGLTTIFYILEFAFLRFIDDFNLRHLKCIS